MDQKSKKSLMCGIETTKLNMLYILPLPTASPPPWDLIINFHRKGYHNHENISRSSIPRKTIKDLINYDKRDQKQYIQTRKLSPTGRENVRQTFMYKIDRYFPETVNFHKVKKKHTAKN